MEFDINSEEVQQAIKEAGYLAKDDVASIVDKEVNGLKKKNEELLGKLKNGKVSQAELIELQSQLKEIEDEKLRAAEDWNALEKNLRKEMDKLKGEYETRESQYTRAITERDLVSELVKANVKPEFLEAVKAMHGTKVQYVEGKVVVGEKPLNEFVSEWANSDEGKHFIAAPKNNGGGAPGGRGGSGQNVITRAQFETMKPRAQSDFLLKEGGVVVDE